MKIEKISENQIRCTLTKEDLATRNLKLSELAYGTEKAKSLFRDMMQQAAFEFGFEANNIPLMIEAIPLPSESIILIITKVEDPEELDTRFAKFAPSNGSDSLEGSHFVPPQEGADGILDLFNKIREAHKKLAEQPENSHISSPAPPEKKAAPKEPEVPLNLTKLYRFRNLDHVIHAAGILSNIYQGENALYKDREGKEYHLLVSKSHHSPEEFNKICNILSEYGSGQNTSGGRDAFYQEHMECLIPADALEKLSALAYTGK